MQGNTLDLVLGLSKVRQEILNLFFDDKLKEPHVRGVAREINRPVPVVSRELNALEKIGLLKSQHVGQHKEYSLNEKFIMLNSFKDIFRKSKSLEELLRETLSKNEGILEAFIFGSYARASQHPNSDIDLFILGDADVAHLNADLRALSKELRISINPLILTRQEFTERQVDGRFVREIVNGPRKIIIAQKEKNKLKPILAP